MMCLPLRSPEARLCVEFVVSSVICWLRLALRSRQFPVVDHVQFGLESDLVRFNVSLAEVALVTS